MAFDLRQVLILNYECGIQDCKLLCILYEIAQFTVLLSQLLDLEVALEDFSLSRFLLVLVRGLKEVMCCDPLVEGRTEILEGAYLVVERGRLF